jgi:hypothetical protein
MVAGMDFTSLFPEELLKRVDIRVEWEHWSWWAVGFKYSPYNAI